MHIKVSKIVKLLLLFVALFAIGGCTGNNTTDPKVVAAINNLVDKMPTEVETDLVWPTLDSVYTDEFEAKFVSTNVNIISDEGEVNRGINDAVVTIKVGVVRSTSNTFYSKDVKVKVLALTNEMVFEAIELELDTTIPKTTTKDINFPTFEDFNAQVSYQSNNQDALTNDGFVTQFEEDVEVTLEVLVTYKAITKKYTYLITIAKHNGNDLPDDNDGLLKVHVIDVGQGDAILIELPNDQVLMIDAGKGLYGGQNSDKTIKNYLNDLGITTIDYLVISHPHSDHYEWVPMLLTNYTVKNIYFSAKTRTNTQYLNTIQAIKDAGLTIQVPKPGDYIFKFKDLALLTIANKSVSDVNASSLMVKLTYKNNSFMFTGDGGFGGDEAENRALASGLDLSADVLKVGHHGSGGSSSREFLAAVGAKYGLLTTTANSGTGHPHETAMQRLKEARIDLYQTRDLGHIIVICDGENYQFNCIKDGKLIENVAPSDPWRD